MLARSPPSRADLRDATNANGVDRVRLAYAPCDTAAVLAEELLPEFDISDELAVRTDAASTAAWAALMDVDLIEVGRRRPLVGLLGAVRVLPEIVADLLHGERPEPAPTSARLRDLAQVSATNGGWTLLGERPGEEIALGLVGKFWRPVIEYADVTADEFPTWSQPGFAKTIYNLGVRSLDERGTLLWAVMRTATTRRVEVERLHRVARTSTRAPGSAATGRSVSVRARTSSSTDCLNPYVRAPRAAEHRARTAATCARFNRSW